MTPNPAPDIGAILFSVAKIVEGAANHDAQKVVAYGRQLAERLDAMGQPRSAKRVREIIGDEPPGLPIRAI